MRAHRTKRIAGTPAGKLNADGFIEVEVDGITLLAHEVAWAMSYGEWAKGDVQHINGIKTDNRLCNLRDSGQIEEVTV